MEEGKIEEGSAAWNELSKTDQQIRKRSVQLKKEKLKNPTFFVSKTRLCIRNLPAWMRDSDLEKLVVTSVKRRATKSNPTVRQVCL